MVLVLGANSYIGSFFCAELRRRGHDYALPPARDYSGFDQLFDCIRKTRPEFLINAAGCAGTNADVNEPAREDILRDNTILPRYIAQACLMTNTPWGHVSSCQIYTGAKIVVATGVVVEKKMPRADLLRAITECPEKIRGFTEADEPNFSFRTAPCNFVSGTFALAEEAIRGIGRNYIWRIGQMFNERDDPENYLRQIKKAEKICNGLTPLSHTDDFVHACIELWEREAAFGIYNVANPGVVMTAQIVEAIIKVLKLPQHHKLEHEGELYGAGDRTCSNCVLDVSKLLATGVALRPAVEAIDDALKGWRAESFNDELHRAAA